jgi:integrase
MPRLLMSAKFVKTVKPPTVGQVDYFDRKETGLVLRVGASGKKTWYYVYRVPGARRIHRFTIDKPLSLKEARVEVAGLRGKVKKEGIDPAAQLAESKKIDTFKDFADFYQKKTTAKKSKGEEARIIKNELLPHWRDRKANEITRADIKTVLQTIAERPAPVMANRVLALISRMYNLGIAEDVPGISVNPATRLPKPGGVETTRDRALSPDEIRSLWTVLERAQHPPRVTDTEAPVPPIPAMLARGLQAILVTGQRPGEVFSMKWKHVSANGEWWDLPRTLTKNGNPHRVPLTKTAQDILTAAKEAAPEGSAYVFAGHMNASVTDRAKKCAAALSAWKPLGFSFHRHDLRRTVGTGMAEEHISTETIARVLNHVDRNPRATRVYDRFSHDPEKRTALEAWERRLLRILAEKDDAGNVRAFAKRA